MFEVKSSMKAFLVCVFDNFIFIDFFKGVFLWNLFKVILLDETDIEPKQPNQDELNQSKLNIATYNFK